MQGFEQMSEEQWEETIKSVSISAGSMSKWSLLALDHIRAGNYGEASSLFKAIATIAPSLQEYAYSLMVLDISKDA